MVQIDENKNENPKMPYNSMLRGPRIRAQQLPKRVRFAISIYRKYLHSISILEMHNFKTVRFSKINSLQDRDVKINNGHLLVFVYILCLYFKNLHDIIMQFSNTVYPVCYSVQYCMYLLLSDIIAHSL